MIVQLPPRPFLTKSLALIASKAVEHLTNPQICDCVEVLSGVKLSDRERRQSKTALLQLLAASVQVGK